MGMVDGNTPVSDNDWETVKKGGDIAIKRWINQQIRGRSCTVVLVGSKTAGRKWITYEIKKSWNNGKGVVGIRIHGLENQKGQTSRWGKDPFDCLTLNSTGAKLSSIVKCYNPAGRTSRDRYAWIQKHLANAVAEAIRIRESNS